MTLVFFDMDDTLLAGDAEAAWAKYMAENGLMQDEGFAEKIRRFDEDYRRGDLDFSVYTEFLFSPIKGMTVLEVQDIVQLFCLTTVSHIYLLALETRVEIVCPFLLEKDTNP